VIPKEPNLTMAGRLLFLEIVVAVVLSVVLSQFGYSDNPVFVGVWLFNLVTATFLFKAARAQGKMAWLYGLIAALGPPGSLFSFFLLRFSQIWSSVG